MAEFEVSVVKAVWSGFTGAPGYSKFAFMPLVSPAERNAAGAAIRQFFSSQASWMLTTWSIAIDPIVQVFDTVTGDLQREETMTSPPATVVGTAASAAYAGGSGFVVHWITGGTHNGRKIRGRTFMVPMVGVYSTAPADGTISSSVKSSTEGYGNILIGNATAHLAVWSRYWDTAKPPNQVGGAVTAVTGCVVPDRAAQLRTRRS